MTHPVRSMTFIMKSVTSTPKPRPVDPAHCAQYMVLLGPTEAPRALLFNGECHYLAEVFDDGMLLDSLVQHGRPCPRPQGIAFDQVMPPPAASADAVRCYDLG